MRPAVLPLLAVALTAFTTPLGACELVPEVGPPLVDRCSNEDSDPTVEVSYTRDIEPLFFRSTTGCTPCHDPDSDRPIGVQLGGLDLTSLDAMMKGGAQSGSRIVEPGAPCDSPLYLKLGAAPPFGSRMPLDGPPFFSGLELELLHDWIAEGADDN